MASLLLKLTTLFIVALAVAIGYLQQNPDLRLRFFAKLCNCLTSDEPEQQAIRCSLLKDVQGATLELGPGPATNMECLAGNTAITSYVGIEPNVYMHEIFYNKTKALPDIGFSIELKTLEGEALGLEDESFDTVIFTHVLCSVRNSTQVLEEVNRVLKPRGTVYFMEHIASPEGTWMRRFQKFIEPVWSFFLGGCRFDDSHHDLDKLKDRFLVHYEFFDAPMPIPFVKPHLIGHAVKKGVAAAAEGEQE